LEKLESIHEKVFKQFNVDLSKPISDKPLKPIGKKLASFNGATTFQSW